MVPPTAKGKKNPHRGKAKSTINKLIVFKPVSIEINLKTLSTFNKKKFIIHIFLFKIGTPIQSPLEVDSRQPKLIAVGINKTSISQYHIQIDSHCISSKVNSIIEAIDFIFKAQ